MELNDWGFPFGGRPERRGTWNESLFGVPVVNGTNGHRRLLPLGEKPASLPATASWIVEILDANGCDVLSWSHVNITPASTAPARRDAGPAEDDGQGEDPFEIYFLLAECGVDLLGLDLQPDELDDWF